MDKKALLEQFEALPLMVAILNDSFIYVDQTNEYAHPNLEDNRVTLGYVNGAWYAFQHQQAKVEELQTHAQEIHKREIKLFEKTLILTHERDELQKRVDALEEILKKATEVVELNIETVERSRDKAKDMHERNYSVSMLYFLKPIRRVLEQALKGEGQ
ncbi:hypothetical protein [Acinetobacter baumannii]|uniref:hypothetical protein n=2 Tax=Acinetobacter baumannii TaxID=470 RepID=UPI00389235E4